MTTINTNLTDLERTLLQDIITDSEFNGDSLDINLPWEEQRLEDEDMFNNFVDAKIRAKRLGLPINTLKGVMGSLQKKNLITISREDGTDWLLVYEEQFNAIKAALAN